MRRITFPSVVLAGVLALALCAGPSGCTTRSTRSGYDAAADSTLDEFEARQKRELVELKKEMVTTDKAIEADLAALKDRHAALSGRMISVGDGSSAARRLHSDSSEQTEFALRRTESRVADLRRDMQDVERLSVRAGQADAEMQSLEERGEQNTRGIEELAARLDKDSEGLAKK